MALGTNTPQPSRPQPGSTQCPSLHQLSADAGSNLRQVRAIIELVQIFGDTLLAPGPVPVDRTTAPIPAPTGLLRELEMSLSDTKDCLDTLETNLRVLIGALTRPAEDK